MKPGFFQLTSSQHLLAKLQWELTNFRSDPSNPYLAFNLFLTAEHLPDWERCFALKQSEPLLAICSHLANGAKHFEVKDTRHSSVSEASKNGVYEEGVYEKGVFEDWLTIRLNSSESEALGRSEIDALSLAEQVVKWWEDYFGSKQHVAP